MKIIKQTGFLMLLVLLFVGSLRSQDLIVTDNGDTLNCKISKIKGDYIYFTCIWKNEIRKTLLSKKQIKTYQYKYFETPEIPKPKTIDNQDNKHFVLGIRGGWSYLIAPLSDKIPSDFENYSKELKSGSNIGTDVNFLLSKNIGIGLKYSLFKTKNKLDNIYVKMDNGQTRYGVLKDDISVNYFGPSMLFRFLSRNSKTNFLMGCSLGYLGYYNNATLVDKFKINGSTLGLVFDLGIDHMINKDFAIGINISLIGGSLSKYVLDNGSTKETIKLEDDEFENLSRIDLTFCLKLYK